MPPRSRIAHMLLADDIAIPDCDYCYSTHFPRSFIAAQCFAPATNTLLYFPLADRRSSQLLYGQSRHSIATALLDFSSQIIAQTLLFFASPSPHSSLLPWPLRIHIMHCLCGSSHCFALALHNNASLFFCFCQTMPRRAIAAQHISSLFQLRSLSVFCCRFADRCAALPLLLSATPCASVTPRVGAC